MLVLFFFNNFQRLTANVAICISFKSALITMCRSNSNANFVCQTNRKCYFDTTHFFLFELTWLFGLSTRLYNRSSILSKTTVQIKSTSATNCGSRPYRTSLESTVEEAQMLAVYKLVVIN